MTRSGLKWLVIGYCDEIRSALSLTSKSNRLSTRLLVFLRIRILLLKISGAKWYNFDCATPTCPLFFLDQSFRLSPTISYVLVIILTDFSMDCFLFQLNLWIIWLLNDIFEQLSIKELTFLMLVTILIDFWIDYYIFGWLYWMIRLLNDVLKAVINQIINLKFESWTFLMLVTILIEFWIDFCVFYSLLWIIWLLNDILKQSSIKELSLNLNFERFLMLVTIRIDFWIDYYIFGWFYWMIWLLNDVLKAVINQRINFFFYVGNYCDWLLNRFSSHLNDYYE